MSMQDCSLCPLSFDDDQPTDPSLMQPARWAVDEAVEHFELSKRDPLCPDCWASKVHPKAWEIAREQEAAEEAEMARRCA